MSEKLDRLRAELVAAQRPFLKNIFPGALQLLQRKALTIEKSLGYG